MGLCSKVSSPGAQESITQRKLKMKTLKTLISLLFVTNVVYAKVDCSNTNAFMNSVKRYADRQVGELTETVNELKIRPALKGTVSFNNSQINVLYVADSNGLYREQLEFRNPNVYIGKFNSNIYYTRANNSSMVGNWDPGTLIFKNGVINGIHGKISTWTMTNKLGQKSTMSTSFTFSLDAIADHDYNFVKVLYQGLDSLGLDEKATAFGEPTPVSIQGNKVIVIGTAYSSFIDGLRDVEGYPVPRTDEKGYYCDYTATIKYEIPMDNVELTKVTDIQFTSMPTRKKY